MFTKTLTLVLLVTILAHEASAQSHLGHDEIDSGSSFDALSGNSFDWQKHDHQGKGETHVEGSNILNGSRWDTTIQENGDMAGHDKEGNHWEYDDSSTRYYNYGTGKTCIGEGAARTCF